MYTWPWRKCHGLQTDAPARSHKKPPTLEAWGYSLDGIGLHSLLHRVAASIPLGA